MNPLPIVYIASIEIITSPPGCKLFYCAEMFRFLEAVDNNGLPQHTRVPYAFASFSRFGKHYSYITFGKINFVPKLLPVQNVVFDLRSKRSALSVRVFEEKRPIRFPLVAVPDRSKWAVPSNGVDIPVSEMKLLR